jgi:hypothetical protein
MNNTMQNWVDKNNVIDIQFLPKNPSATSATEIINDANKIITAYENNKSFDYIDPLDRNKNA